MNKIFTFAFIPFVISCVIRYYIASATGVHPLDIRTFSEFEMWGYGVSAVLVGLSIWHIFLRPTCTRCKSYFVRHLRTEELNQYHTTRKVKETANNGSTVTRHLTVTVAEMRSHFDCGDCGNKWSTDFKRDKK